jgi:hypothetical protein
MATVLFTRSKTLPAKMEAMFKYSELLPRFAGFQTMTLVSEDAAKWHTIERIKVLIKNIDKFVDDGIYIYTELDCFFLKPFNIDYKRPIFRFSTAEMRKKNAQFLPMCIFSGRDLKVLLELAKKDLELIDEIGINNFEIELRGRHGRFGRTAPFDEIHWKELIEKSGMEIDGWESLSKDWEGEFINAEMGSGYTLRWTQWDRQTDKQYYPETVKFFHLREAEYLPTSIQQVLHRCKKIKAVKGYW